MPSMFLQHHLLPSDLSKCTLECTVHTGIMFLDDN